VVNWEGDHEHHSCTQVREICQDICKMNFMLKTWIFNAFVCKTTLKNELPVASILTEVSSESEVRVLVDLASMEWRSLKIRRGR
jgi:hypothetical protein